MRVDTLPKAAAFAGTVHVKNQLSYEYIRSNMLYDT